MKENITVYELLEYLRKIDYIGVVVKTVDDAVRLYSAIKTSGGPHRP